VKALLFILALCVPCSAQIYPWPNNGAVVYPGITVDAGMLSVGNPSSPGTTLTQAISNSMTACGTGCTVSTGGGGTQITWDTSVTGFTVGATQSGCSNLGPVTLTGSTTYAAGALANDTFAFANTNTFTQHYIALGYSIAPTNATEGACVAFPAQTISGGNLIDPGPSIFDILGNYSMVQLGAPSSTVLIRLETGPHALLHSNGYALTLPGTYLISNNYTPAKGSLYSGTYTSGGTITGTTGQTCNLAFIGGGGTGATATVALTGTNTIASATAVTMTPTGQSGYTSTATTATLSSGSAACSGTATVVTVLGGLATMSVHSATGALLDQETLMNYAGSTVQKFGIGNNENQTNSNTTYFGPIYYQWTSPSTDMFGGW